MTSHIQITTAEQLDALPAGTQWRSANGRIGTWDGGEIIYLSGRRANVLPGNYLEGNLSIEFPLTVVWQPRPDQETTDA